MQLGKLFAVGYHSTKLVLVGSVLTVGVTRAANLQPNLAKIDRPRSIIINVTVPVAEEKLPIKAE